MNKSRPIIFWNRYTKKYETETVYGDKFVKFLYETFPGQNLARILSLSAFSKVYGIYQSSPLSRREIARFIREYNIDMDEFEKGPFKTFNDFFIRKFIAGARPFTEDPNKMAAFSEARYLAWTKIERSQTYPVKGEHLSAGALLGNHRLSNEFAGGPLVIARLCPVDYHRFHYPDDGQTLEEFQIPGRFHSVNPLALKHKSDIFITNERHVSILETKNLGKLAYIEVGAMSVGKIVQTHDRLTPFQRGDEKGYFLFGASTVILMGQAGAWAPSKDLVDQSAEGRETFVKLGDAVASVTP